MSITTLEMIQRPNTPVYNTSPRREVGGEGEVGRHCERGGKRGEMGSKEGEEEPQKILRGTYHSVRDINMKLFPRVFYHLNMGELILDYNHDSG